MAGRMERHGSDKFYQLFEETTAEPGSLGEIVDKHAGDAVFLSGEQQSAAKGADSGLADFVGEMGQSDPDNDWEEREDDKISFDAVSGVDITGSTPGIARGFGSHVSLDLGSGGFQIEDIPETALSHHAVRRPGEELDDYDDDNPDNGKFDPKELEDLSIPGSHLRDQDSNE